MARTEMSRLGGLFVVVLSFVFSLQGADFSGTIPARKMLQIVVSGDLTVRGTSTESIKYTLSGGRKTPPRVEGMRITFSEPGAIRMEVPRATKYMQLASMVGMVDVADLDGSVRADVPAGKVMVDRVAGDVEIHSSGGPAFIGSVGGLVKCYSGGGAIHAAMVRGEGVFETRGGDIQLGQVVGPIRAVTAGGGIQIQSAGGAVYADTYGGPIEVLRALGAVVARSAAGPIRLNNVSGRLLATTISGTIIADILADHSLQESLLSTGNGDISVLVPSNVGVTIEAECDGLRSSRAILCDFTGLRIYERNGVVMARGNINGGGPLLRLTDNGGRIEIKKK